MAIYDLVIRKITDDLSVIELGNEADRASAEYRHSEIQYGDDTLHLHFAGKFARQDVQRISAGFGKNLSELDRVLNRTQ